MFTKAKPPLLNAPSAMLAAIFIPIIVAMEPILQMWLGTVPPKAAFLCRCLLFAQIIDQSTYGLHTANQAIGHIRNYTLLMYTPKLAFLPLAWIIHLAGGGVNAMMGLFLTIELVVALMRIPYLHRHGGLEIGAFSLSMFPRVIIIIVLQGALSLGLCAICAQPLQTLAAVSISILCGMVLMWAVVLNHHERARMLDILRRRKA